jgi:hypothetical protein
MRHAILLLAGNRPTLDYSITDQVDCHSTNILDRKIRAVVSLNQYGKGVVLTNAFTSSGSMLMRASTKRLMTEPPGLLVSPAQRSALVAISHR